MKNVFFVVGELIKWSRTEVFASKTMTKQTK